MLFVKTDSAFHSRIGTHFVPTLTLLPIQSQKDRAEETPELCQSHSSISGMWFKRYKFGPNQPDTRACSYLLPSFAVNNCRSLLGPPKKVSRETIGKQENWGQIWNDGSKREKRIERKEARFCRSLWISDCCGRFSKLFFSMSDTMVLNSQSESNAKICTTSKFRPPQRKPFTSIKVSCWDLSLHASRVLKKRGRWGSRTQRKWDVLDHTLRMVAKGGPTNRRNGFGSSWKGCARRQWMLCKTLAIWPAATTCR